MKLIFKVIFIGMFVLFSSQTFASAAPIDDYNKIKVGEKISLPELPKDKTFYVLQKAFENVVNNKTKDIILLVGEKDTPDDLLTKNVHIVTINPKTKKRTVVLFSKAKTYIPKMYFGDMNGDGVSEILNEYPTSDGNRKNYLLVSIKNDKFNVYKIAKYFGYKGKFADNFVLQLKSKYLDATVPVTLYGFKDIYIADNIYDKTGKLLKPITTAVSKVQNMYFADKDNNGKQELYADELLTGISEGNIVAYIYSKLEMVNNKVELMDVKVCGSMYTTIK